MTRGCLGRVRGVRVLLGVALGFVGAVTPGARAQQVTLPLAELQSLWDRARAEAKPDAPLVALEAARLDIEVGEATARVTTELGVWLRGSEWQTIAVPLTGRLASVRAEGVEVRLEGAGAEIKLALRGAGRGVIHLESRLELSHRVERRSRTTSFDVRWPMAAVVSGTLHSLSPVERADVAGAVLVAEGTARWRVFGAPGGTIRIALIDSVPEVTPRPFGAAVDSFCALTASRARLKVTDWVQIHTWNGVLERVRIPVPKGYEVLDVKGDVVAGWQVDESMLEVFPTAPISGTAEISVQLAADLASEFECPLLTVEGVHLSSAAVRASTVDLDGLVELADAGVSKRLAADSAEGTAGFRIAPGEPFRVFDAAKPPRFRVTWPTSDEVLAAVADRLVVEGVAGTHGEMLYRVWVAVRNTGVVNLRIGMPDGARLLASSLDGAALRPGVGEGMWVVPIGVQEASQVIYLEAIVPLLLPAEAKEIKVPLPRLSVPASRVETRLVMPPGRVYGLRDAGQRGTVGPVPLGLSQSGQEARQFAVRPLANKYLQALPGFQVLETSWSGWSDSPAPIVLTVAAPSKKGAGR